MSDTTPTPESVRLSNALDNLGSAVMAVEGASYSSDLAIVRLVEAIYEHLQPSVYVEILDYVDMRTLRSVISAAKRFGKIGLDQVEFIEAVYEARMKR